MTPPLNLDTSAVLRAVLEAGRTPEPESRLASARLLLTSRLSLVESARVLLRVRNLGRTPERRLADVERELDSLWARCEPWEITPPICDLASRVAPTKALRTLDALHLATFLLARRRLADLELLTVDGRLREAAGAS
ncbi:MAG: PIN domain-containing protein [Planctomycetes bacterium]|nr:PIN domain-containing protein [Planctomycetota bacterium]